MELRENRTELERLLGGVWDYEDVGDKKSSLPKWLFALTLTGAVVCTLSPSDIVVPVMTALASAPEKLVIDNVSSANVAEDLDFRIARHTDSPAGWRAFLDLTPTGRTRRPRGPRSTGRRPTRNHPGRRRRRRTTRRMRRGRSPRRRLSRLRSRSSLRRLPRRRRRPSTRRSPRRRLRRRSWPRRSRRRRPSRLRSRTSPRHLLRRRRRPSRRPNPRRRPRSWPRRSQGRRLRQLRSRRTRRCRRQDHGRSRPRSPQSQRVPVICAPSITRPVHRMF